MSNSDNYVIYNSNKQVLKTRKKEFFGNLRLRFILDELRFKLDFHEYGIRVFVRPESCRPPTASPSMIGTADSVVVWTFI